jgi:hypothetical protein
MPTVPDNELNRLEAGIIANEDAAEDKRWRQAEVVVRRQEAGEKQRDIAATWINGRTGEHYHQTHVSAVARVWLEYSNIQPRPDFRETYNALTNASRTQGSTEIDQLKPHPRNYRQHPEDQIEHLVQSLQEHGFYRDVVIARDGTILAGHGLVEAARHLGLKKVPTRRLDLEPDSQEARRILTGDNEVGKLGMPDTRALTELLRDVRDGDAEAMLGTGYNEQQLAALVFVSRRASEIASHDAAAEWVGMPVFEPAPDRFKLVLSFDNEAERDAVIEQLGVNISARNHKTCSAWYPPRERADLVSLRFNYEGE